MQAQIVQRGRPRRLFRRFHSHTRRAPRNTPRIEGGAQAPSPPRGPWEGGRLGGEEGAALHPRARRALQPARLEHLRVLHPGCYL
eukprot:8872139-Pyramimonas_sp.AAC.1